MLRASDKEMDTIRCLINSTSDGCKLNIANTIFVNTRKALTELQSSLKCQNCDKDIVDIHHLGGCDHCFCSLCAEPKVGKVCPICSMPPDANRAKVDLQLSNIASLCHQMFQLFEDHDAGTSGAIFADSASNSCKEETENPPFTSISSAHIERSTQRTSTESARRRSSLRDSLNSSDVIVTREKNASLPQHQKQDEKMAHERERRKPTKKLVDKKPGTKTKSKVVTPKRKQYSESPKSEEVKTGDKPSNSHLVPTPKAQKESETPKRMPRTNVSKRNAKGETPLQVATIKADLAVVKKLLLSGANPNVKDNAGWTPLHEAVNHGNLDITELLVAHGASVNAPGLENDTPLHDAVSNYQLDCVSLLVSKGANIYLRNSHGLTPLDVAQTDEVKQLLLSGLPKTDFVEVNDQTLFEETSTTICLLAIMSTKEENTLVDRFVNLFHCKLVEQFTPEVTHLVLRMDAGNSPLRTMKYLSSIITGKWIVSSQWLQACIDGNKFVSEKEFLIPGPNSCLNASQKSVENRLKQLPPLFDGCQFYLYSKRHFSNFTKEQITELIKLGGGLMLSREPRLHNLDNYPYTRPYHAQNSDSLADCTIYKIYDDVYSRPSSAQSQRMACLPLSWLIDSILAFTLLEKTC